MAKNLFRCIVGLLFIVGGNALELRDKKSWPYPKILPPPGSETLSELTKVAIRQKSPPLCATPEGVAVRKLLPQAPVHEKPTPRETGPEIGPEAAKVSETTTEAAELFASTSEPEIVKIAKQRKIVRAMIPFIAGVKRGAISEEEKAEMQKMTEEQKFKGVFYPYLQHAKKKEPPTVTPSNFTGVPETAQKQGWRLFNWFRK